MKERPILFSGEMVRAILEGRKTQTRRVVGRHTKCPYGKPGDLLWVRETWGVDSCYDGCSPSELPQRMVDSAPAQSIDYGGDVCYRASHGGAAGIARWRPSIHMPRWASRIAVEVMAVRVERLQEITGEDCIKEGHPTKWDLSPDKRVHEDAAKDWFMDLWIGINGNDSWSANPWVWVIEFKKRGAE